MKIQAIVLAGGKGTRIAALHPNIPKPMIPVRNRPFLHWVTKWLSAQGIQTISYSVGHHANVVEEWVRGVSDECPRLTLNCIRETQPLGTGGAILACLDETADIVVALNGDSLLPVELAPNIERFLDPSLDGVIFGLAVPDATRYGTLIVDDADRLKGFAEKRPGAGFINGGIYMFRPRALSIFTKGGAASLEYDLLPQLIAQNAKIHVSKVDVPFIDIGVPETLAIADDFIRKNAAFFSSPLI